MEPSSSTESTELELLERVFLRLGAADNDTKLQATLEKFLVPTILKSGSNFKSVQNKVLEILTHVNRRLHSRLAVLLPLRALLELFAGHDSSPHVINFSLVYIKLGFHRLTGSEQSALLPDLVKSIDGKRLQQQDSILRLFTPSLVHFTFMKNISKRSEVFSFENRLETKKVVLEFMQCYLLLPYSKVESRGAVGAPAGLSWTLIERLTGDSYPKPEDLEKIKTAILRFLSSEIFTANEVIAHFIIAVADPKHSISDEGDHLLKKFGSSANLEQSSLISQLYTIYQGTVATPGKRTQQQLNPKETRTPASLRLRLRLIPYFIKSTQAANTFPSSVQVIFDSLFGEISNGKLRIQTLYFIQHILHVASDQKMNIMAPVILTGLNKIINQSTEDPKLQVLAYVAIGSLAKRVPSLFIKETRYVSTIFDKLKKDLPQDLVLAVQECLSLMAAAYRGVKGQSAIIVEALLLENIYSESVGARLAAVQYAGSVFPFHHIPSRFVCMIGCGDSKEEVRDEGKKGLIQPQIDNPFGWDEKSRQFPEFCSMLQYLHKRVILATEANIGYATATGKLPFHPFILTEGIRFLRLCLSHSAGVTEEQTITETSLPVIVEYLKSVSSSNNQSLLEYLDLLKQSLGPAGDVDLHSVAMGALLELVATAPQNIITTLLASEMQWIKGFTHSSRAETREPAARVFGLLAKDLEHTLFMETAEQVLKDTSDASYGIQHGGIVSLGHLVAVLVSRLSDDVSEGDTVSDFIKRAMKRLVVLMKTAQSTPLVASACKALGNIFRSGTLPLLTGSNNLEEMDKETGEEEMLTKTMLVECLAHTIMDTKLPKIKEHCMLSLSYLSVGESLFPLKDAVLESLFKLKEEKAVELQFTVGEALATTLAGPLSTAAHDPWKPQTESKNTSIDLEALPRVLDDILTNYAVGTSPVVRQSSCIWLLSLLKHASRHPGMQIHLKKIQIVFVDMLTEQSEVTQEVASRGMGLVYEMSKEGERGELVEMLVGTLMEGRKSTVKVTEETKLFEKGQLGKDPKGGNISTYKELCSLASDLNKPDLVYKFMTLANHNAIWNSKKGAAYSFSSIASHAQDQLAPYLPSIVPRLYRYKYDPNPGIQQSMTNIWSSIIPESKKAVDEYLTEIMRDLITNLNSSLWRNRQSSCMALGDLLVSRQVGEIANYIPQLWELVLRVRDDIKETVRKAADYACKSLHKVTVRACDGVTMTTTGVKVVQEVLPILLKNGMTNPSGDIKAISILSILKISQNAGSLLKPHIAELVPTLLESLSSLEPQKLNTYSLQFTGDTGLKEKLDDLRIAASKSSPMMEIINLCVPQIGSEELTHLVPRLVEVMKSGVGLGTKIASAQFVVSLVHHNLNDLTPFAGKLMNALVGGLYDRNSSVRKACAKSIGHLVKVTKDSAVTKMITRLKNSYFEKDDSTAIQTSAAYVFHAIATYSLDTAKSHSSDILPLVFLAMHAKPREGDESLEVVTSKWKETWDEIVPGTQAGVRLHLPELVGVVCPALQSQSWLVKAQGAAAIATITENMSSHLGPPHLTTLLTALLEGLQGRTWEGKEVLLRSLSSLCKSCTEALLSPNDPNQPPPYKVCEVILSQCKKKDHTYKVVAIECAGNILETLKVDRFQNLMEILLPILNSSDKEGEDSDDEDRRTSTTVRLDLQAKAFIALGQAWPSNPDTQGIHYNQLMKVLTSSLPMTNWKLQVAILTSLVHVYERLLYILSAKEFSDLDEYTIPAISQCLNNVKYNAVRAKAILAIEKIIFYHKEVAERDLSDKAVSLLMESLKSLTDDQLKEKAIEITKTLSK